MLRQNRSNFNLIDQSAKLTRSFLTKSWNYFNSQLGAEWKISSTNQIQDFNPIRVTIWFVSNFFILRLFAFKGFGFNYAM